MKHRYKVAISVVGVVLLCGAGGDGCTPNQSQAQQEANRTDQAMTQITRNQPVPIFDWSLERRMLTEIYQARQQATHTFSVVQSEYTGKVLWSCPSIGFPLPYSEQLTNPLQGIRIYNSGDHDGYATVNQAEPNGLYSPPQSDATWVPCIGPDGKITPVYEEKHVTVFLQPMEERGGQLTPTAGATPSFSINPQR